MKSTTSANTIAARLDPYHTETGEELRRRALIAAGLFFVLTTSVLAAQVVVLLLGTLPAYLDPGMWVRSILLNVALDVLVTTYVAAVWLGPRLRGDPRRVLHLASVLVTLTVNGTLVAHIHFAGSQGSYIVPMLLGTIVVVSWFVPWRTTVWLTVATSLMLVAVVALEAAGIFPYAPLIRPGWVLRGLFVDWHVYATNASLFAGTLVLVLSVTRILQRSLARSRAELGARNEDLRGEVEERQQAQASLEETVHKLERANLDLERFAHMASHDLRAPLRAIRSFADILQEDIGTHATPDQRDCLQRIVGATTHMNHLLTDLRDLACLDTGEARRTPCDLQAVLEQVLTFLRENVRAASATVTAGDLPRVVADEGRLAQVLQNLLSNALKFRGSSSPEIHVDARREADAWIVSVSDNGVGLSAEEAERVFEPFVRLVPRGPIEGTGMGLAICRTAVESMGGRIWVESLPAGGARFSFSLPASA